MCLPKRIMRNMALVLVVVLLVSVGGSAIAKTAANDPDAGAMVADTLIARPLGLASLVFGSAIFVVALPFSAPSGTVSMAAKKMIVNPAMFTFTRPLGKM